MKTYASIALIEHQHKILCVWNRHCNGWGLPGGKVENGETPSDALVREVREETGLEISAQSCVYADKSSTDESRIVYVFRAWLYKFPAITPYTVEEGSPIDWLTREALIEASPFKVFYQKMFRTLR